jgi:single-strand selective monofunctional uracil DNA glycosylase
MTTAEQVLQSTKALSERMHGLTFAPPVTHVYNPLAYAWSPHADYIKLGATGPRRVLFMGMNPGPWGMAQVGVPFGEVAHTRDWLGIDAPVEKPENEHPKRPVEGFACTRSEVSGRRLWGFFAERFGKPEAFFEEHFIINYCPLVFMEESGRNRTPDKLPAAERQPLFEACDAHLGEMVDILSPEWIVGVGAFAANKCRLLFAEDIDSGRLNVGQILHPSPASPAANRDWAGTALKQMLAQGIWS